MKVFLDACVLFPNVMREMLLGAAKAGLYEPLWSPRVLEEWARAAAKFDAESEARTAIAMARIAFPRAEVDPRARDMNRLVLPDPNDIHVLAAAISGSATLLITLNAKDFPRHTLNEEGLSRQDADGFLISLFHEDPDALRGVAQSVFEVSQRMEQSHPTASALLKKARLPRLAKALRS